jgi:multisubunit Na+/H+ antiporter MnhE subunit
MPKLVTFLARHAAFGFLIAAIAVALMMIVDFAGLRTLIWGSDVGLLSLFLLTFFLGLTLASVQMGIAIILLNDRRPHDGDPGS